MSTFLHCFLNIARLLLHADGKFMVVECVLGHLRAIFKLVKSVMMELWEYLFQPLLFFVLLFLLLFCFPFRKSIDQVNNKNITLFFIVDVS